MRVLSLVMFCGLLVACRHPTEVRGLYAHDDGAGAFVPCDRSNILLHVSDSALTARYRLTATKPYEPLFVRLRGVQADSGSIYGGQHHFLVRQILEIRTLETGECPSAANRVSSVLR